MLKVKQESDSKKYGEDRFHKFKAPKEPKPEKTDKNDKTVMKLKSDLKKTE